MTTIQRIESSTDDFARGALVDTKVSNNTLMLEFEDEEAGEYKESGYRVSPKINFKFVGTVEISLSKTATTLVGTIVELEISIDNGDTWENVDRGGSIQISASTPTVVHMRAKQQLYTNLNQLDDTDDLDGSYEIPDSELQSGGDIAPMYEDILGIETTQDNTITPELDEVDTTITLVDGKLRQLGQMLFKGKYWSQEMEGGTS